MIITIVERGIGDAVIEYSKQGSRKMEEPYFTVKDLVLMIKDAFLELKLNLKKISY